MSSHFKRSGLLIFIIAITLLIATVIFSSASAVSASGPPTVVFVEQGFGKDASTWPFTPTVLMITPTNSYSNSSTTTPTLGSTNLFAPVESLISKPPSTGNWFWGMKDLSNCEFTYCQIFVHELEFEKLTIPNSTCAVLSFDYFASHFDQIEQNDPNYLAYSIIEDGTTPITGTLVSGTHIPDWQTFTHDVSDTTTSVSLKLIASHDGEVGHAGFDNIVISIGSCIPLAVTTSSITVKTNPTIPLLVSFTILAIVTGLYFQSTRSDFLKSTNEISV